MAFILAENGFYSGNVRLILDEDADLIVDIWEMFQFSQETKLELMEEQKREIQKN